MAKRYGVPYQGSKNKIAGWVVSNLPKTDTLVDLFFGGGAITHCAMEQNKYRNYIGNDIAASINLFQDAVNGRHKNETRWISREDFFRLKDTDEYVRLCWSFGNDGRDYMYSKEVEPWKKALWFARVFNDSSLLKEFGVDGDGTRIDVSKHYEEYKEKYSRWYMKTFFNTELSAEDFRKCLETDIKAETEKLQNYLIDALKKSGLKQSDVNKHLGTQMAGHYFGKSQWAFPTREEYQKLAEILPFEFSYDEVYGKSSLLQSLESLESLESPERLQSLESLQSLQSLQSLESPERLTCFQEDYRDVPIPGGDVLIYADIPYKNTVGYGKDKKGDGFDHEAFEKWLKEINKPVIVSEYTQPAGTVKIASIEKYSLMDNTTETKTKKEECLFINERFFDWYLEKMDIKKPITWVSYGHIEQATFNI